MLFNSAQFAVFFVIVYAAYLVLNHRWQNRMLLVASYVFYGAWDWRFLSLLFLTTAVDYYCGLKIGAAEDIRVKKLFVGLAVCFNLTMLGFFKYFNFFASSLQSLLARVGLNVHPHLLKIILPIGISFYTFQAISYVVDVYRGQLKPAKSLSDFALFVAFFPQLVAGPIERASHLLPQVLKPRILTWDKFRYGCWLIFWGLFQKIFVADNLARIVDPVFGSAAPYDGAKVLIAIYAFAFQIFCDFNGYSLIARGLGSCMGFNIMLNFNLPYFSTNPREFWQRWHISLSTWLRDYLYIPLGGDRKGAASTCRNLMITMLLGGLWHGAAWTFVIWGAYHGVILVAHRLIRPVLRNISEPKNPVMKDLWFFARVFFFFHLTCAGWLIFRAGSVRQILDMVNAVIFDFRFNVNFDILSLIFFLALLIIIQVSQFTRKNLNIIFELKPFTRFALYAVIFYSMLLCGVRTGQEFVYFQF